MKGKGEMCVRQPPSLALQTFLIKLVSSLRTPLVPPLKDVWINTPNSLWVWIKLFLCACNILQFNTWNKHKCRISVVFPTVFFTVGSFHWCSRKCSYWCVENEHQFAISSGDFLKIRFKTSSTFIWQPSLCKHLEEEEQRPFSLFKVSLAFLINSLTLCGREIKTNPSVLLSAANTSASLSPCGYTMMRTRSINVRQSGTGNRVTPHYKSHHKSRRQENYSWSQKGWRKCARQWNCQKQKGIRALTRVEKRRSDESLLVDKSHKHELVRTHNKIAQEKEIKQEKRWEHKVSARVWKRYKMTRGKKSLSLSKKLLFCCVATRARL